MISCQRGGDLGDLVEVMLPFFRVGVLVSGTAFIHSEVCHLESPIVLRMNFIFLLYIPSHIYVDLNLKDTYLVL